jgi:hypothetical protein
MPKGFFTQSAFILLEQPVAMADVRSALQGCTIRGTLDFVEEDAQGHPLVGGVNWAGTDVLVIDLSADGRAALLIDVLPLPWPDHFGRPDEDIKLFAALVAGQFGPFVYPESLERALAMGRASDRGLGDVRERHRALLRLRSSWVIGAAQGSSFLPTDYDPTVELRFLCEIASNLLELPGALCYFNPNGEVLATPKELEEVLDEADEHHVPPLALWVSLRPVELAELAGWAVVDTLGLWQLDRPDHEAFFRQDRYELRDVALFLHHALERSLRDGLSTREGEIALGPGRQRWRAHVDRLALVPMPRPVVRWVALDGSESQIPPELLEKLPSDDAPPHDA